MTAPENTLRESIDDFIAEVEQGNQTHEEATEQAMQAFTAAMETERKQYDEIFKWLLGESGDFPESLPGTRYNWRPELRKRLAELVGKK